MSEEPNILNEEKEEILNMLDDVIFEFERVRLQFILDKQDVRSFNNIRNLLLTIEKKVKALCV